MHYRVILVIVILTSVILATQGQVHRLQGKISRALPDSNRSRCNSVPPIYLSSGGTVDKRARRMAQGGLQQYLVQFDGPVHKTLRQQLENKLNQEAGDLGSYMHHYAFVITINASRVHALSEVEGVAGIYDMRPEYKYTRQMRFPPELMTKRNKDGRSPLLHVLLAAQPSRTLDQVKSIAREWQQTCPDVVRFRAVSSNKIVADFSVPVETTRIMDVVDTIARRPLSLWIEPAPVYKLCNAFTAPMIQSGSNVPASQILMNPSHYPVWVDASGNPRFNGTGEIVGCADSGLDYDHCFFGDPDGVAVPLNTVSSDHRKIVAYYTVPESDHDASDTEGGHGTHVVGTILGSVPPGHVDFRHFMGMAPGAKVVFTDIGKSGGESLGIPEDLNAGLFPLPYDAGARIHSNSWGGFAQVLQRYSTQCREIDTFSWDHKDFLILVAAGNEAGQLGPTSSVPSPATAKNALSVGASMAGTQSWTAWGVSPESEGNDADFSFNDMAYFSSQGPTQPDMRIKPDVVAPGYYVASSKADGSVDGSTPNPSQCTASALKSEAGTSMATPAVAGAAALVRQYIRSSWMGVDNPSAALIKAMLIHSGQKMNRNMHTGITTGEPTEAYEIGTEWPNYVEGYGRVQLSDVLYFADTPTRWSQSFVDGVSLDTGEFWYTCFSVTNLRALKATITWTDPTVAPNTPIALVNNLDLLVQIGGRKWLGNHGGPLSGSSDTVNNVEQVYIDEAIGGTTLVRIVVKAIDVPQGPQPFAFFTSIDADSNTLVDCPDISGSSSECYCAATGICTLRPSKELYDCLCLDGYRGIDCSGTLCIHDCFGSSGVCQNGQCMCAEGFAGQDCRYTVNQLEKQALTEREMTNEMALWTLDIPENHLARVELVVLERGPISELLIWEPTTLDDVENTITPTNAINGDRPTEAWYTFAMTQPRVYLVLGSSGRHRFYLMYETEASANPTTDDDDPTALSPALLVFYGILACLLVEITAFFAYRYVKKRRAVRNHQPLEENYSQCQSGPLQTEMVATQ